ncbi:flagellar motor switch protein, C-ring protein [Buchnera aphidicola (Cinara tujafilina)]|uniref:Flagellar motor switch protein, C-ring protein n=1 Tax=Buchnera aphidicola (Cinara tujafilina) TaxID=261317 RepID=F7WYZ0_9GAMM|nr:FliM/FliN family flagellar motor switch protein [Buchnera aphidicola]AEH39640.1 flagellar motor switch protein, C-ring protein [Buchnera aphidicola (Cinara tujafilina)]
MKLIYDNIQFSYQKSSINLDNKNISDFQNSELLKKFLLNRKISSFKNLYDNLSLMFKNIFKKNLSILFEFTYLYFEYNNQYHIKQILVEEESNIFQLSHSKEYCILMVPHNFFSICTYVLFGGGNLVIYKKHIYDSNKINNHLIINTVFESLFITINSFLKKFFCCSIKYIFKNQCTTKNFFKNNTLDDYLFFLFQVTYKNIKDVIKICIPKSILYHISFKPYHNYLIFKKNIKNIWNKKIEHNIKSYIISLKVNVISYTISLSYFLNLKVGDIFYIKIIKDVFGFINGQLFLLGKYGIYHGYRSLYFKQFINKEDKYMEQKGSIMVSKDNESIIEKIINQEQKNNKTCKNKLLNQEKLLDNISKSKSNFLDFIKKMKPFMDIPIAIKIELGTKKLSLKKLLKLSEGSIIQLNQTDTVPLKIFINNYFLALGELVMINEEYGVRIIKLIENVVI